MKSNLLTFFLIILSFIALGQDNSVFIQKVDSLSNLAWELKDIDSKKAIEYAQKALLLADSIGHLKGKADAHARLGVCYKNAQELNLAKKHYRASLRLRFQLGDSTEICKAMVNYGIYLTGDSQFDSSYFYYDWSRRIAEKVGNYSRIVSSYSSMAYIHLLQDDTLKALNMNLRALRLAIKYKDERMPLWYSNVGEVYKWMDNNDSALYYFFKANHASHKRKDRLRVARSQNHIGICLADRNDFDQGLLYIDSALSYAVMESQIGLRLEASLNKTTVLEKMDRLADANEVIEYVEDYRWYFQNDPQKLTLLRLLYLHKQLIGEYKTALDYKEEYHRLRDSIYTVEKTRAIEEMESKYQKQKLRTKNIQQRQELEKRRRKQMILTILLASAIAITILLVILFQQRLKTKNQLAQKNEELHLQKLDELAKEKQLEKITALMEGQEQERARIAGELHDGLGSLLATVKHHFEVVEGKMDEGAEQYEKAYELLDQASEEVRRISHDMASNVLSKFGLVPALRDLVETVSNDKLKINLKVTGLEDRLENSTEIHLFRIIQELVSNILRHARASEATIQLTMRDDALSLIVEDNGQGFDTQNLPEGDGMGLGHMKARVEHLNGEMNIDSKPGHGSTTVIEISINS